jgi:hypothetical protein
VFISEIDRDDIAGVVKFVISFKADTTTKARVIEVNRRSRIPVELLPQDGLDEVREL